MSEENTELEQREEETVETLLWWGVVWCVGAIGALHTLPEKFPEWVAWTIGLACMVAGMVTLVLIDEMKERNKKLRHQEIDTPTNEPEITLES